MSTLLDEIRAKCSAELIAAREHGQIAAIVSAGRKRPAEREIGKGTILEVLGLAAGNTFLDIIDGNADFRHVRGLVAEGRLRIDSPLVQATVDSLVAANVLTAEQGAALKALGFEPAPVSVEDVIRAMEGV